jgi:hypothetical protein
MSCGRKSKRSGWNPPPLLVLALLLLVLHRLLSRSWDQGFALGCAGLVAASALIMAVATTRGWNGFAGALLR